MKIKKSENTILVAFGPSWKAGLLLIIFGLPFILGGVVSVLAFLGLFTSEGEFGPMAVLFGTLLVVIGCFFVFCGSNAIFGYDSFEFILDQRVLKVSHDGIRKRKVKEYGFGEIDHIVAITTRNGYRTGKMGSALIVLKNRDEITISEDFDYESAKTLVNRIGKDASLPTETA